MNQRTLSPWARRPDVRIGAVLAIVALVAFLVWLLLIRDSGSGSASQPSAMPLAPVAASSGRIRDLSVEVGRPIYWLGPEDKVYELQPTSQDRIYVRYLPPSASIGTTKAAYPLVGTYPVPNAYGVLKSLVKTSGATSFAAPRGAIAVYSNSQPTNIYLAYPGSDEQIEVYDPVPGNARTLVDAGRVIPVGS